MRRSRQVTHVLGITGAPGAGKSTVTGHVVRELRADGPVAVLAVDPSSPTSGGAILGDRLRMDQHNRDDGVFIRSLATRGHSGGLAMAVPQAIAVLNAAGYAWIVLETVGVGQIEVDVASIADTTVVVMNPGWGDDIQASKAGLIEVADIFLINKADRDGVETLEEDLRLVMHLSTDATADDWVPPVMRSVGTTGAGIDELVLAVREHVARLAATGALGARRRRRARRQLEWLVADALARRQAELTASAEFERLVADIAEHDIDPWSAAEALTSS